MSDATETCIVCDKVTTEDHAAAHRYFDGRRFTLCCPICLRIFEQAPDRFARGDRPQTLIQQLIDEIKWRDPSS
ncbi:MAG: hypothetical protein HYV95_17160 [Opitutae bacterium]|nr:hypothetical protein [Opitutae bacterium]